MNDSGLDHAYRRYFPLLRAKCTRMLGATGEADEAAQEAFVRLWRSGLIGHASETHVCAWLYRVSTHLALDQLRARRRTTPAPSDHDARSPEALATIRQQLALLSRHAPKDSLAAAALCRLDGLDQLEAARVLDVSERTLRRLLDRFDSMAKEVLA